MDAMKIKLMGNTDKTKAHVDSERLYSVAMVRFGWNSVHAEPTIPKSTQPTTTSGSMDLSSTLTSDISIA